MATVPLFLLEEHHEAFLAWNYAVMKQWIAPEGSVLLHVDEHSDLQFPVLNTPPHKATSRLEDLIRFTYSELSVASFLIPALYLGLFHRVYWLRQKHDEDAQSEIRCITSENGTRLRNSSVLHLAEALRADRRCYRFVPVTDGDNLEAHNEPVVLDIDLDYFSCDNRSGEAWEIEITRQAYESFRQDPYHPLRLAAGGLVKAREHKGSYYIYSNPYPEEPKLVEDETRIDRRIEAFLEFLARNAIRPVLIDIARSRFSGYTPSAQWQTIEQKLLGRLSALYEFDILTPADLAARL